MNRLSERSPVGVEDVKIITDPFIGIYKINLKYIKKTQKMLAT